MVRAARVLVLLLLAGVLLCGSFWQPHAFGVDEGGLSSGDQDPIPHNDSSVSVVSILERFSGNATTLLTGYGAIKVVSYEGSVYFVVDDDARSRVDPYLLNMTYLYENGYLARGDDQIGVIVQMPSFVAGASEQAQAVIRDLDGTVQYMYSPHLPYMSAHVPYANIQRLVSSYSIERIWLRLKVNVALDQSVPIVKDPTEWSGLETQLGTAVNGTGVTIAVLDTGVDSTHPDLANKIAYSVSFVPGESPSDGFGHGTHVATIAAGTGAASGGRYRGVAPGASLLNVKVLSNAGYGYSDWIISGIQWAADNGAHVLSMSFGANVNGDGSDPLSVAVDWAADRGVLPVVAAGNSGYGTFTVGTPAVAKKAVTVGATTKTDEIAYFSSRGPTSDWRIKPDVLAPGVDIVAGRASGTSMGSPIDEFYTSASGTSMATPHVSGAAALLLQVDRTQTPDQVKARLMNSARELANLDVWAQGSGRIDCYRAATAEARLSPASWTFGQLSSLQATSTSISIMNDGRSPVSFAITTSTTVDGLPTGYVSTTTSNGTLNGLQELLFSLSVGPFNSTTPEGWFEGWLEVKWLTDPAQELHMPYLFILVSTLEVTVYDVDGSPVEALVTAASYPGISGATSVYTPGQGPARLTVKSGDYAVFAELAWVRNDPRRMFALEGRVTVPRLSTARASFSLGEARVCSISTTSSVGEDLTVHAYMQMLSGGTPAWDTNWQSNFMEWGTGSGWFGFDLASDKLTFYTTTYDPADRVSLNLGFYASDTLHSEVQLMPFKFWNIADLPSMIAYPKDQLATWDIFFDVPETYPANGLRIMNAFWFTWDYTGLGFQLWGWDLHEIHAGIRSKYLLGPGVQWPWLLYLPTYADHEFHNPAMGPLQEIHINEWNYPLIPSPSNRPPAEGQNGSIRAGDFEFAPYAPGLLLSASQGQIRITGDVWRDLTWPHLDWHTQTSSCGGLDGPVSPYPQKNPAYELRVDGLTLEQGELSGRDYVRCLEAGLFGADWTGIDKSWTIAGAEVVIVTLLPALGAFSSESLYTLRLDLSSGDPDAPVMRSLTYPSSYVLGQEIQVLIDSNDASSGVAAVEVLFSYDGTTWNAASYDGGIATFTVDYDGSDSIDVLVRVKDNSGNYAEFINRPAMLNAKAVMRVEQPVNVLPGGSAIIGGNLTTTEGKPIHGLAVSFSSNSTTHHLSVNQGEITQFRLVVPSTLQCEMVLAPVGLHRGESVGFTIEVANQYNVAVFTRRMDGLALTGVEVSFGSETQTTDSSGKAEFSVPRGTYALTVQSPLTAGSGIQYILSQWADGASGNPRSVTVNASAAFDVRYKTQYQLTMQVDPSASAVTIPSVGINWYDSGQTVDIQASPASGYIFRSWAGSGSGSYTGTANPASVTMNAPVREVASLANQNGVMISGVSVVPDPVIQGSKVVFKIGVANLGTSKVSSLKVQLAVNRPDGSLAWSKSASISTLYAGAQKTIQVAYTVPVSAPAGNWTYSVYLYRSSVLLDHKTDGSFTVDPRVIAGSIVSVSDSPDPVARGKTVTFTVTIKNTGNIVWPAVVTIKIYRPDGALTATRTLTGKKLQPNVEYTYRITWNVPSRTQGGVFHYEVYLKHGSILIGSSTDPGSTIRVN